MKHGRIWVGVAFWCGLVATLAGAAVSGGSTARRYLADLWGYYASDRAVEVHVTGPCELAAGDPVFAAGADGLLRSVGIVLNVAPVEPPSPGKTAVRAVLFRDAPEFTPSTPAQYLETPVSLDWVVRTLLPPERMRQIEAELAATFREHRDEVLQALQPVINRGVRDALAVLEQDVVSALEKRRPQLQALAAKGREEILKAELVPLVRAEIWPLIRRDSEPLARQVSGELWERISLWRFAWRGVADRLPVVPGSHRVEEEMNRFLDQEAIPIFQRHEEDFLALTELILQDVAENDQVKAALRRSVSKATADADLQRLLSEILHEAVVANPRFWGALRQSLNSPEARDALQLSAERFEPTVRRVADLVIGTREGGLTPEFNLVLRQQILLKDRRGLLLGDLPPIVPGPRSAPSEARPRDALP
jgi:hypothetical protein